MEDRNLISFDWVIKRLLRNKADFVVLEGFLSELFKEDVKIQEVLESEGNQETEKDKFNRVDILVKDSKGELIIIEIQNQNEIDYFHRMTYGTSKIHTEYLSKGEAYENLKKVYSINIVYFDLGQGEDYVYHGKTDFTGIHNSDKLLLSTKQKEILKKREPSDILPEYYVIKVNQFDDLAKDTLDQWIYYLKNDKIKNEFTAKGLDKAREHWRVDNLSELDKKKYSKYLDNLHYKASMELTMKIEAEDKIMKKGIEKGIEDTARNFKKNGVDIEIIIKSTGLTKEEIEKL